jgi:hypothetical protein
MKDLFEGLHALVNIQTIVAFLLLVVPGSIALRTYDRRRARQARKLNESIVDIVVVSFICDALWSAALSPTRVDLEIGKPISVTTSLIAVAALIATPILLAIAFVFLEDLLANAGSVSDPEPQPWDKWFQRVKRDKIGARSVACTSILASPQPHLRINQFTSDRPGTSSPKRDDSSGL